MIGDPSGKSDMRKLRQRRLSINIGCFKKQMSKFIDTSDGKALFLNNGDWLLDLNYIEFIREIGVHFSVNRMLGAECYKKRLETGLTFLEFNYMLMQSYDFYKLNQDYGCKLEFGGDDQGSNILGGVDLIRRKSGKEAYGMTFGSSPTPRATRWVRPAQAPSGWIGRPLLTTSSSIGAMSATQT